MFRKEGTSHLGWVVTSIILATWLRTWHLNTLGVFFGDAAFDLWSAWHALETGSVPLLGIASSLPRFHQGPLHVWLLMVILKLTGPYLQVAAVLYALIGVGAVVCLYELMVLKVNKVAARVATLLLACSPMAVAHARVPFYLAFIPLLTLAFLWQVERWRQHRPASWFLVAFSWGVLFQFELALLPLAGLIPIWWWLDRRRPTIKQLLQLLGGGALGLAPQILYDLTHGFQQLGFFGGWVGYRIATFFIPQTDHALSVSKLSSFWASWSLYLPRMVSVDHLLVGSIVGVLALLGSIVWLSHAYRRLLPSLVASAGLGTLLLIIAFVIHGAPSEAYYPPLLALLPVIIGYGVSQLTLTWQRVAQLWLVCWAVMVSVGLVQHNWLVSTDIPFNYGPSVLEQRQILQYVAHESENSFRFVTTDPLGVYPSYFDNLRWLAHEEGLTEQPTGQPFLIEPLTPNLPVYPNSKVVTFPTRVVLQVQ